MPDRKYTNVVYAADDDYAMLSGVSMVSLFENNRDLHLRVFFLSDHLSDTNKFRLESLAEKYNNAIEFIEIYDMEKRAGVCLKSNNWGKTVYCRLFLSELIPEWVEKMIYIDSDTLVTGSIKDLVECLDSEGFKQYYAAGCRNDVVSYKRLHGFKKSETYYNSGVLLINLELWRQKGIQSAFIREMRRRKGRSIDPDQSYINCLMINRIMTLPAKYNVLPPYYSEYSKYLKESGYSESEAYSKEELAEAVRAPVIVHFAGDKGYRPWYADCRHSLTEAWFWYLRMTAWKDFVPTEKASKEELSLKQRFNRAIVSRAIRFHFFAACYVRYKYGFKVRLFREDQNIKR